MSIDKELISRIENQIKDLEGLFSLYDGADGDSHKRMLVALAELHRLQGNMLKCMAEKTKSMPSVDIREQSPVSTHMESVQSPVEKKEESPVFNLKQLVSIMDYYRFLKVLFHNDNTLLDDLSFFINSTPEYPQVLEYVDERFVWDEDEDTMSEFMGIVEKFYYTHYGRK